MGQSLYNKLQIYCPFSLNNNIDLSILKLQYEMLLDVLGMIIQQ